MFDRGQFVSFANCGLPYFVGDVIHEEQKLLVASPALFRDRFSINVRVGHDVTAIDRERRVITVKDLAHNTVTEERYDALVLATGAQVLDLCLPSLLLSSLLSVLTFSACSLPCPSTADQASDSRY